MKICTECKIEKDLEDFGKHKATKDGKRTKCKVCRRLEDKEYRLKNKNVSELYYELNKDKISNQSKSNYLKNKTKILSKNKLYRDKNEDKIKKSRKKSRLENEDKIKKQKKEYRDNNKERIKELRQINIKKTKLHRSSDRGKSVRAKAEAKRRAIKILGAFENTNHENYLIECLYKFCQFKTSETEIQHHVDHIKPLSKGGKHNPSNLQILTAEANLQKSNTY